MDAATTEIVAGGTKHHAIEKKEKDEERGAEVALSVVDVDAPRKNGRYILYHHYY